MSEESQLAEPALELGQGALNIPVCDLNGDTSSKNKSFGCYKYILIKLRHRRQALTHTQM